MKSHHNPTVVQYAVARLADLGIQHCFGVPGDYAFSVDDAVEEEPRIAWVVSSNELNAAYAADGYARVKGASMLSTTYGVGELSAINGVMGSYAECVPVFHLVGVPSWRLLNSNRRIHHSLGDGDYGTFMEISKKAACCHTVLTPENCILEIERVIKEALKAQRPAYILLHQDYARMPVLGSLPNKPGIHIDDLWTIFPSVPKELDAALSAIMSRLGKCERPFALVSYKIQRYKLQELVQRFINALGIPFACTPMDKGVLNECQPLFAGIYKGDATIEDIRRRIEDYEPDLVLDIGGCTFDDFSTGFGTSKINRDIMITLGIDYVEMISRSSSVQCDYNLYHTLWIGDVIQKLLVDKNKIYDDRSFAAPAMQQLSLSDCDGKITYADVSSEIEKYLDKDDILITDIGNINMYLSHIRLPSGCQFMQQTLWSSIGWATAATLGVSMGIGKNKRAILVTGDGAHQMTATDIGTMGKHGINPVIVVLKNDVYGIELYLEGNKPAKYNNIPAWHYSKIPEAMGCKSWYCTDVRCPQELQNVLKLARSNKDQAYYIEIILDEQLLDPLSKEGMAQLWLHKPPEAGF